MSTPKYDALKAKVRDWSNKREVATIPDSIIEDCLNYSADECYRLLRIPPLETTITYTVAKEDNTGVGYKAFTSFLIPEDLTQFSVVRVIDDVGMTNTVFNEITDKRTFLDQYAEKYSRYNWMWSDNKIFLSPQLAAGVKVEIKYYRRLPSMDAQYSVEPINYILGVDDADQPYLSVGTGTDTPLYFAGAGDLERVFATLEEATTYGLTQPITTVTTKYYIGKEVPNWLRDQNERLVIWGALQNLGAYLFDEKMESRYEKKFMETIESLNKEEKWRRTLGGNVQMNVNTYGQI